MAQAYKCDRCKELFTGIPDRVHVEYQVQSVNHVISVEISRKGYNDNSTQDLCPDCLHIHFKKAFKIKEVPHG